METQDSDDTKEARSLHGLLGDTEATNEEYERADVKARPYYVWHEEGERPPPTFATWREALDAQVRWNKDCPGHAARRRRVSPSDPSSASTGARAASEKEGT